MSESLEGATILVVDDEDDLVDLYELQLESEYNIRTAYGGEEALEKIDSEVDLVLLDRRMPDLSGDEVLKRIRVEEYDCLVVMLTAVEPDFDLVDMGCDEYVIKPVSEPELRSTVEEMLTRAKYYDEELRERLMLASKRAVLKSEKSPSEREQSEEYAELERRLEEVHQRVDAALSHADDDSPSAFDNR
ncbi:DNA-binding protein [Halobacteriales archaeon SW_7_68_16]|nr:MAG: DNA-binding protein [Halobacteriales archaeon SW_7_68_16]